MNTTIKEYIYDMYSGSAIVKANINREYKRIEQLKKINKLKY